MNITEVLFKFADIATRTNERILAFASITLDDMFVIRDLKVVAGNGGILVAFPSRKLTDRCNHCGTKNHLRARFCNDCGSRLDERRATRDGEGKVKLHADLAHPITAECRQAMEAAVLAEYHRQVKGQEVAA